MTFTESSTRNDKPEARRPSAGYSYGTVMIRESLFTWYYLFISIYIINGVSKVTKELFYRETKFKPK